MNINTPDDELPFPIDDAETIVRSAKARFHLNQGQTKILRKAFVPPLGERNVSVIRQRMGNDFCKNKSAEICKEHYVGVILITAAQIRHIGSLIDDARKDFFTGHAHIDHGLPPNKKDEPLPPVLRAKLDERCDKLAEVAVFRKDPFPSTPGWKGPRMRLI